mgnify:CR=1 FL=1
MVRKSGAVCPPGVFCFTPGITIFLMVVVVIVLAGFTFVNYQSQSDGIPSQGPMTAKQFFNSHAYDQRPPPPVQIAISRGGDDRYTRAPEPLRFWNAPSAIPMPNILPPPFGFATQGYPESYQSYGFIATENGQTLPLYGRRTASRSDRYNYYTRTDTYNPVPVPLFHKKRYCQDSVGCEELFNGEHVRMANGVEGKVSLYQFDGPPYIPYV